LPRQHAVGVGFVEQAMRTEVAEDTTLHERPGGLEEERGVRHLEPLSLDLDPPVWDRGLAFRLSTAQNIPTYSPDLLPVRAPSEMGDSR